MPLPRAALAGAASSSASDRLAGDVARPSSDGATVTVVRDRGTRYYWRAPSNISMTGGGMGTPDLTMMVALDALLRERNVTRAAHRLGQSQPTMSASLAKLRRHFDDELLSRRGNTFVLTPLGERLLEQAPQALATAQRLFQNRRAFDPASASHEFSVVMSDAHLVTFGRALTELIRTEAPGVHLRLQHSTDNIVTHAARHLQRVDALVLPQGVASGLLSMDLYQDRWVCVISAEDTDENQAPVLTAEELSSRPWVLPYDQPLPGMPVFEILRAADIRLHVVMTTENFLAMPDLISGTDIVGLMPSRVL